MHFATHGIMRKKNAKNRKRTDWASRAAVLAGQSAKNLKANDKFFLPAQVGI